MIVARNAGLLYLSFIVSGLINVAAQSFFARTVPDQKQIWLAATLLLGTFASMSGVAVARRIGFRGRPAVTGAAAACAVTALVGWSLRVDSIALYIVLHLAVRALANFATQEIDRRAVALAGAAARQQNDRVGTGLRFTGMLLGPLWFGLFPRAGLPTALVLGALTLATIVTTREVAAAPPIARAEAAFAGSSLRPEGRVLVAAAVIIYASFFLLASNILYVLSDLQGVGDSTASGGLLITVCYGSAIVGTVVSAPLARRGLGLRWMLVAPAMIVVTGLSLRSRVMTLPFIVYPGAVVLGLGFALFLLSFREHVTREAQRGEAAWIAIYNNLGNTSAVLGFGSMLALVAAGRALGVRYGLLLSAGVAGLGLAGLAAALVAARAISPGIAGNSGPGRAEKSPVIPDI
jgi:hypothetical protein